jgi:hypothetical protein
MRQLSSFGRELTNVARDDGLGCIQQKLDMRFGMWNVYQSGSLKTVSGELVNI